MPHRLPLSGVRGDRRPRASPTIPHPHWVSTFAPILCPGSTRDSIAPVNIRSPLLILTAPIAVAAVSAIPVEAAPVVAPVVAPSKSLDVALGPGVEVITTVELSQSEIREISLPYLRQVRATMYDNNVPFDGRPLREAVTARGLTRDQYVHDLLWSGDMERIAVQRAVEEKYSGRISHDRANNTGAFTATLPGGVRSYAENLCQGHITLQRCLEALTYGEERHLRRSNGMANSDSGHLYNILNPRNSYVGVGAVDRFYVTHHSPVPSSTQPLADGATVLSLAIPENDILRDFSLMPYRSRLAPGESTDVIMHNGDGFDLPGTLSSGDNSVATTSGATGDTTITALALGKTTITFLSQDARHTDSTSITVAEPNSVSSPGSSAESSSGSNPVVAIIIAILATLGISAGLLGVTAVPGVF
ncbi:hypothetical protein [Corynebacterium efficiens YS-314]|uniref:SCP domain-containing protein n=1 Tax=Corynebacterium efficiens (strain DSM 44549 / YS-314 / AJ 12310 / JCM 11189 / NBRC 100395) TaxID=196164 RepID=Q8FRY7_COREF|nr:hypothetical protein [Corynebacterium efficiens YS-314]